MSEIRTSELENINLNERFFETGFLKNSRKSTLRSGESLLFFFPKKFKIYLQNYIYGLDGEFLVPISQKEKYASSNWCQNKVNTIRRSLEFNFSISSFYDNSS